MKHAGSVRSVEFWSPRWVLKMCILLSILHTSVSFTPPRIIYGGWTPILPGHPFYFGPARRRIVEQSHHENDGPYQQQNPPINGHFREPPVHNVEHHYEQHIEFVDPGQINQYTDQRETYPHSSDPHDISEIKGQQVPGGHISEKDVYAHFSQQQSYDGGAPINEHGSGKDTYSQYPPQQTYEGPQHQGQPLSGHNLEEDTYSQYPPQSEYGGSPGKGQQVSPELKTNKDIYSYYPPQSAYDGPQNPNNHNPNEEHYISNGHSPENNAYTQFPPQSSHGGSHDSHPIKGPQNNAYSQFPPQSSHGGSHDSHPIKGPQNNAYSQFPPQSSHGGSHDSHPIKGPQNNAYTQFPPQSSHGGSHDSHPIKGPQITSDHKSNKDIFAYYPPQSAYDGPKQINLDYKPIYFENPRKPLDIFDIPKGNIPFDIHSLKNLPIKTLNAHDLHSLRNAGEKTYLKITPLGDVDSNVLKQIGDLNFDQIQYLGKNPLKQENYPIIKDLSASISPKYPGLNQFDSLNYGKQKLPLSQLSYNVGGNLRTPAVPYNIHRPNYKPVNTYKGTDFSLEGYAPLKQRPLNPIETKKYQSNQLQALKLGHIGIPQMKNYKDITVLPNIPSTPIYPSRPRYYPKIKYHYPSKTLSRPYGVGKNVLSPAVIGQMRNYFRPKYSPYSPVHPLYPKAVVPRPVLPKNPSLIHLPLSTLPRAAAPRQIQNYLPKNVKLETLYKNPSIVTNIRGSPALIEREVAIIHVPVTSSQQTGSYPNGKEYLFYTASTPESTQIRDFDQRNKSTPYITLNKHAPLFGSNDTYSHISLDYGRDEDTEHASLADISSERPKGTSQEIDNSIHSPPYQNDYQYIFVSSSGVHSESSGNNAYNGEDETKKQFFHAYYAPADHVAPPGYVKMTVHEFNNLFKNAEIRYVDKEPSAGSSHENDGRNSPHAAS